MLLGTAIVNTAMDMGGIARGIRDVENSFTRAGQGMIRTGTYMTASITAPLLGIGAAVVDVGADFEEQTGLLGIALRRTGVDMETVRGYALKMGAETVFSARDMAAAMTVLAKAGQDWEQIAGDMTGTTGSLAAATNLAAASELDLAQAADVISIAMATFNLTAEEAVPIVDNFVQSADASVTSVSELVDAMANVGPVAAMMGWSLQDTNQALAILSERGIRGSEAGTALRSMMLNLNRPTDKVKETLQELNVSLYDAEGAMKPLPEIIGDLEKATADCTEEQRNQYFQTLAGTYGIRALATLVSEGADGWEEMGNKIADAAVAQDVATVKTQTLKGRMEALGGSLETLGIILSDIIIPFVKDLVDNYLIPFFNWVSALDPKVLRFGLVLAGVAAAAGPLLVVLGVLVTIVGALGSAFLPIVAVIAAVGLVIAALAADFGGIQGVIQALIDNFNTAREEGLSPLEAAIRSVSEVLKEIIPPEVLAKIGEFVETVRGWFVEHWPEIQATVENVMGTIQSVIDAVTAEVVPFVLEMWGVITAWFEENWPLILETVTTILDAVWAAIQIVLGLIEAFWMQHGDTITRVISLAWETLKLIIMTALQVVLGIIKAVMQIITGDWSGAWETIKGVLLMVWEAIKQYIANVTQIVLTVFGAWLSSLKAKWSEIWTGIKTKLAVVWAGIVTTVITKITQVYNTIKSKIDSIRTWIKDQASKFRSVGRALIEAVRDGVLSAVGKLVSAAKGVVNDALQAARNLLGMSSPAKAAIPLGEEFDAGMALGIKRGLPDVVSAVEGLRASTLGTWQPGWAGGLGAPAFAGAAAGGQGLIGEQNTIQIYGDVLLQDVDEPEDLLAKLKEYEQ